MEKLNERQLAALSGNYGKIARMVGCTPEYVRKVVRGKVGFKRGKIAPVAMAKAKEFLAVLDPIDKRHTYRRLIMLKANAEYHYGVDSEEFKLTEKRIEDFIQHGAIETIQTPQQPS